MASWRDQILSEFTPQVAHLTLVADPDGLLLEEGLLQTIRDRGFELIPFEDHVAFRFAYESQYRSLWDRGELTDLVVVLRAQAPDLRSLPFDLLQAGRKLSFNLGHLFPNLSYPVVAALDRSDLDTLYHAQVQHNPGQLGDNATKDFVLRHVFEVAPELVRQPSELLRLLIRRHYRRQIVPPLLDNRLVQVLRQSGRFDDWPLHAITPDREVFFAFLQERWPLFLNRLAGASASNEKADASQLRFSGPREIPFEHDDIRVYMDDLFVEGYLRPVDHKRAGVLAKTWAVAGLRTDPDADLSRRLESLIKTVEETVPTAEARHQEWASFAHTWAQLVVARHQLSAAKCATMQVRLEQLERRVDAALLLWAQARYAGLHNQPSLPPVVVHHVPRAMARWREEAGKGKVALVVVDGLALDQWLIVREELMAQRSDLHLREDVVFAWVPTITSISRQAIFAGKAPLYFPSSIYTTEREPLSWTQFWVNQGVPQAGISYLRGLGEDSSLDAVADALAHPKVHVIGLVIDKVDKIIHGMQLGTAGMHNQVRQWARQGFLAKLIDLLHDNGFGLFLTADHGNVEARGCGRPAEGAVAELRGERARVYTDVSLRGYVKEQFPDAIEWSPIGLPQDCLPLLAVSGSAFVSQREVTVAHGGAAIGELLVPFVQIGRIIT